jgi:anaerobic ribonucleoside-triphosphate reductase activating protein
MNALKLRLSQVALNLNAMNLGASQNRMAIWTYGCNLACPGCTSAHTWKDPTAGKVLSVQTLISIAKKHDVNGLTISGGEPSLQSKQILLLVKEFKRMYPAREVGLYTGLTTNEFKSRCPELMNWLDVLISGPYIANLPPTPLTGSSNQEGVLLTDLAKQLYEGWQQWPMHQLQVVAQNLKNASSYGQRLTTVGIPDNQRINIALEAIDATVLSTTTTTSLGAK